MGDRTEPITSVLLAIRKRTRDGGIATLRIVVEPTGVYHKLLLPIARTVGFETAMVDADM